jgi:hypothetical protein
MATMQAGMLFWLQYPIVSHKLISTSCMNLLLVNPFCARLKIKSRASLSLVFNALDKILYIQLSKEIGRQLVIREVSPFFGMSFRRPDLKVGVSFFLINTHLAYRCRGTLKKRQHFFYEAVAHAVHSGRAFFYCIFTVSKQKVLIFC